LFEAFPQPRLAPDLVLPHTKLLPTGAGVLTRTRSGDAVRTVRDGRLVVARAPPV
jgi:hypothetical protein